ncbi:hypothetical protein BCR43DRAFT_524311 [Syncephalastrum racemosum]|uniref:Uncharacterized protein n=1 Tax=Syncephalastrum racemosum TaxID=13706 RepID=A0A1X2HCV8_SYNRA|nr:hypothetical protein BCR43DRAFT_524311 [Syncephalastrum racemosum]
MDTKRNKRFSFASFFSKPSPQHQQANGIPPSASPQQQPAPSAPHHHNRRRAEKSQSLYLQSFRKNSSYDPSEATQKDPKAIRNTIRRSLSAVLYATPQKEQQGATLVPVLVTDTLSDKHGGMIMDAEAESERQKAAAAEEESKKKNKTPVEYDNTFHVVPSNKNSSSVTLVWQGYGYEWQGEADEAQFESEIWSSYRGLIHPLHLASEDPWSHLTVAELKRYFDNYGSMLLKLREASMLRQQRQYLVQANKNSDFIIPGQQIA